MPIYLSQPLDRSQVTSQQFKDRGISSGAPVSVSNARLLTLTTHNSFRHYTSYSALWALTASLFLDSHINLDIFGVSVMRTKVDVSPLFPTPPLVITILRPSEDAKTRLTALGFQPQSAQRYNYYKGPSDLAVVPELRKLGCVFDCYTPFGTVNVKGAMVISMLNRLFFFAAKVLGGLPHLDETAKNEGGEIRSTSKDRRPFVTKEDDVEEHGMLFPYFDGLVLVDKSFTPSTIMRMFSRLLGTTPDEQLQAGKLLLEGWTSVSTTPAGMAISHLVYGLSLAESARCGIKPILLSGQYNGFVLAGKGFSVFNKSEKFVPVSREDLQKEILDLDKHSLALIEIAIVLSDLPVDGVKQDVIPEAILSARSLHNLLRVRSIDADTQNQLRELADRLSFDQSLWEATNADHTKCLVETIVNKSWFPSEVPFAYKGTGALFTKDHIMSALAAFGVKAPTLIAPSTNLSLAITKDGKFYEKVKQCTLRGIPYYVKPLQNSLEDWTSIVKSKTIQIKHAGNDRMGVAKLPGVVGTIPFTTGEGKAILAALGKLPEERKRGRDGEGSGPSDESIGKKRRKAVLDGNDVDLFAPGGSTKAEGDGGDDIMDWFN